MKPILFVIFAFASAFAQQQPAAAPGRGGRGPAAPPPQLTAEQKSQYQAKIDELYREHLAKLGKKRW